MGWGLTNITLGQMFVGNQINLNANGYVVGCQGVMFQGNNINSMNLWFYGGTATKPNLIFDNTCNGFGGGAETTLTIVDRGNSVLHWNNFSLNDLTGDHLMMYATNPPVLADAANLQLSHTNSFMLVDSNAVGSFYLFANHGTGTLLAYPIQMANGDGNGLTNGNLNTWTNSGWTTTTNGTAPSDGATIKAWMNVTNNSGKLGKVPVYY